jgi:hypothetical protein
MCEQDFYKNNSVIGGQGHFAPDYEEGPRDQDREVEEKISLVGQTGNDRKGDAWEVPETPARSFRAPTRFYIYPKEAYCASAGSRRLPRVSEASKVSLRVAASVAHRKQVRAQRAHY